MTTKDFYLSSYLVASGYRLAGHTRQSDITMFRFDESDDLTHSIEKYYGLTAMVEPVTYSNAIRNLKSLIHSNANAQPQQSRRAY